MTATLVFLVCAALWALITWGTINAFRSRRVSANTPSAQIRSAPQGYVELTGEFVPLDPDHPVTGPFSGKECIWYQAQMGVRVDTGEGSNWHSVFAEEDPRPALISDGTGHCLVMVTEAWRLNLVEESWSAGEEAPEPIRHCDPDAFNSRVFFEEKRIDAGPGYVLGDFRTLDTTGDDGKIEDIVRMFMDWRTDYMADIDGRPDKHRPNPGPIDKSRRDLIPQAIARWVREAGLIEDNRINVMAPTGDRHRPFVVGLGDEKSVQKEMRRNWIGGAVLSVLGGAGLVVWLVYGLLGG